MTDESTPTRDDLPLPDFDHLSVGTLAHRVRALDAAGIEKILGYERAHGDRLPVVTVLEQRLRELREGAEPSGGDPNAPVPGQEGVPGGSSVSPVTQGPQINPPPHGPPAGQRER